MSKKSGRTSVAFRVDATSQTGGGHVMRCLTLAQELRRRNVDVVFLIRESTPAIVPALGRSGFPVAVVDTRVDSGKDECRDRMVDAVVVDSYALGFDYETALAEHVPCIMVIDDFTNRPHACHLLLDQTFARRESEFAGKVPADCVVLVGAPYMLVRSEFMAARPDALERRAARPDVQRILVSFGLSDFGGLTAPTAEALLSRIESRALDVVLGPGAASVDQLRSLERLSANIRLHIDPASMAVVMAEADLAVGAAGSTTWERCCLGLPSVIATVADNQADIACNLAAADIAVVLHHGTPGAIAAACLDLIEDDNRRTDLGRRAARICDGRGPSRVADALIARIMQLG